jgi:serine/threonine protein kinase
VSALATAPAAPPWVRPAPPLCRGARLAPGLVVVEHLSRNERLDVYVVRDEERDGGAVAKLLRPDALADSRAGDHLRLEGELLERFAHPHLVRAYETRETARGPLVVLELLGGDTLAARLERAGRLPVPDVAGLGRQLCSALGFLHRHGWLHLDVKPGNVIVQDGRAKLIDLSVARRPGLGVRGYGTPLYGAPEQAAGGALTTAADVWGVGATLFAALTGDSPFAGGDGEWPQRRMDAPALRTRRRVPAALGRAVDACLARDPAARPDLAGLAAVLDGFIAG